MKIAHELHIPLSEVHAMAPEEFVDWIAYFKIQTEANKPKTPTKPARPVRRGRR